MTSARRHHYSLIGSLLLTIVVFGAILFLSYSRHIIITRTPPPTPATYPPSKTLPLPPPAGDSSTSTITSTENLSEYFEVTDGCGPHFAGDCLRVRSGPGLNFDVVSRLRTGMVLKIGEEIIGEDGARWYKVVFDEWLRYPERITDEWYVSSEYVSVFNDEGDKTIWEDVYSTTSLKRIVVDRSDQTLTAFEDDLVFMQIPISTGLELTPTPRGTFSIFKKTPSRYMQGPLPGLADRQVYDLPGVPWNLYFTEGGAVIHGAYWHNSFGSRYSHGCVNLSPENAKKLYYWADLGVEVTVRD